MTRHMGTQDRLQRLRHSVLRKGRILAFAGELPIDGHTNRPRSRLPCPTPQHLDQTTTPAAK
jgi:hypothetical protein